MSGRSIKVLKQNKVASICPNFAFMESSGFFLVGGRSHYGCEAGPLILMGWRRLNYIVSSQKRHTLSLINFLCILDHNNTMTYYYFYFVDMEAEVQSLKLRLKALATKMELLGLEYTSLDTNSSILFITPLSLDKP